MPSTSEHASRSETALTIRLLSKTFLGQRALDGVDLSIAAGEVRGLVGQNGSGKSTMIKVLAGFHTPDEGSDIRVAGRPLAAGSARASEHLGLRFVHQDLGLIGSLDVAENLALGRGYASRGRLINWRREHGAANAALAALGYRIDSRRPVGELAMSERTAVALARALSSRRGEPSVLVLDEPTAALPAGETSRLLDMVRRVGEQGIAVLFVSHHLAEVFEVCDTVTVLRNGRVTGTRPTGEIDHDDLIEMMVGQRLADFEPAPHAAADDRAIALDVSGVSCAPLAGVSFRLRSGEIAGVAGLTGSGRECLATALFGGTPRSGRVVVDGAEVPPGRPSAAIRLGMALVPAQRHVNAAFLGADVGENITVVGSPADRRWGFIRRAHERSQVAEWLARLDVRPRRGDVGLATLSGGNQQKVMIARWLRRRPRLLILDEPTQGVDVGAKADIHRLIDDTAAAGTAILVISTDHEELARLCGRVLILVSGRLAGELRGEQITADHITAATSRGTAITGSTTKGDARS